jgi:hypothetical protein
MSKKYLKVNKGNVELLEKIDSIKLSCGHEFEIKN